ncbi:protein jagged-2-like [Planococcus citri]|uniref:protein jagged-2-like n=1 Tax=Planococcus citri TaxID=170843 RepID=UPI0031F80B96
MRCYSILLSNFFISFAFIIGLLQSIPGGRCSGTFELQILEIENLRGEVSGGECCGSGSRLRVSRGGASGSSGTSSADKEDTSSSTTACTVACRTFFKVCLKEYQNNMSATSDSCSYGNTSSPVLGANSFTLADPDRANGKLIIRFKFSWTRAFTLWLEALDLNNHTTPGTVKLIEKATYSGIILPSSEWHTLNHHGNVAKITYRIRVQCDKHYFNSTCMKFCRPRDDKFGHYTCDPNGDKECIAGWKGANCEIAVCKTGCHLDHGRCDHPGGCECRPGWRGEFCDQCQPYPGCKHGFCNKPYDCICNTNWGGMLCDKDLNYCGTHEPCQNGGTCSNTAPDQYMCTCPEGLSGSRCEVVINPCVTGPCVNGGTCIENLENQNHYQCLCPPGWTGSDCSINIDECASSPCQNGGTCVDAINGYQCLCSSNWEGDHCQLDVNECEATKPCKNAISCQNLPGDYQCECVKGFKGKNCEQNLNDCVGQCKNGGVCIDLVDDYYCSCSAGYTGKDCQTDINECENSPCKNGGECEDLPNGFRCICPVGYAGDFCQIDYDHCSPNPCANNATCLNMPEDYYCHCTEPWQGKNCTSPKVQCTTPPCDMEEGGCLLDGQPFPNNSNWKHKCNTCGCLDGQVRCTNVWCGSTNCYSSPLNGCGTYQICVTITKNCLSPPCYAYGECRNLLNGKVSLPSIPAPPTCQPNQAVSSDYCMRMSLFVDIAKLRPSVTTEDLCNEIRALVSGHEASKNTHFEIVVLCDLKLGFNDTVEVTLSSSETVESSNALKDHVKFIGEQISRKQVTNQSILYSVISVVETIKPEETILITENKQAYTGSYIVVFQVSAVAIFLLCAVIFAIIYCNRCSIYKATLPPHNCDIRNCEEEKSNNMQNEENFRRYANPLKEDSSCNLNTNVVDVSTRINVVRPISRTSSGEIMEMINDSDTTKGVSNKALLSKTQNTEFQKHSLNNNCCCSSKEAAATKPLNIKIVPFVPRTIPQNCDNSVLV